MFETLEIWFSKGTSMSGMGQGTFTCMSLLDQILSAEFFSKNFKLFWRWKLRSIGLFWHPAQLIKSYKSCPLVALKMSIFLAFRSHARQVKAKTTAFVTDMLEEFWCRLISWQNSDLENEHFDQGKEIKVSLTLKKHIHIFFYQIENII